MAVLGPLLIRANGDSPFIVCIFILVLILLVAALEPVYEPLSIISGPVRRLIMNIVVIATVVWSLARHR